MATQTGTIKFRGRVGDLIGYRVGDTHYLRAMPQEVRQSPRSKISSRLFGKASKLGAAMRHAMSGLLDTGRESTLVNRLNKALLAVLREDDLHRTKQFIPRHFQGLQGFCFNPHAGLSNVLTVTPSVTRDLQGNIQVAIPAIQTHATNSRATHVSIKAIAVCIHPGYTTATAGESEPVVLDAAKPAEAFTLVIPAQQGAVSCVILEVTALQLENGRLYLLQNKKFETAEVIAVLALKTARLAITYSPAAARLQAHSQREPYLQGLIIHPPQRE